MGKYAGIKSLLHSRKVLVAAFAVVQSIVLHYYAVDPEVWGTIAGLASVLIAAIAYEDGNKA